MLYADIKVFAEKNGFQNVPSDLKLDGKIHRFGKNNNCWYIGEFFHKKDGTCIETVTFGDWRKADEKFTYKTNSQMTKADKASFDVVVKNNQAKIDKEKQQKRIEAANEAEKIWKAATDDEVEKHEYFIKKQLKGNFGIRSGIVYGKNVLLVPMRNIQGDLWGLQRIDASQKRFMNGQTTNNLFHIIGRPIDEYTKEINICEGFSTGASIYMATTTTTVVTFSAQNLVKVARDLKVNYPPLVIKICGDDDAHNEVNSGKKSALEAAKITGTTPIFPNFKNRTKESDFNDLHVMEGLDEVREQLTNSNIEHIGYIALGSNGSGEYYFYSFDSREVISCTTFSTEKLLAIAHLDYWKNLYSNEKDGVKVGVKWDEAKNFLINQCKSMPIYSPSCQRGTGIWRDGDKFVLNTGKKIICEGKEIADSELSGKFVYVKSEHLIDEIVLLTPMDNDESKSLIKVADKFLFEEKSSKYFLMGWLAIARICGALPVRPNIWITGSKGTGKTTILEEFCQPLLGKTYVKCAGIGTTEAGFRSKMKSSTVPVILDEFEVDSKDDFKRNNAILGLIRQAYSGEGGTVTKGTVTGGTNEFKLIFCSLLSSIRVSLINEADKSRFTLLELKKHSEGKNRWQEILNDLFFIGEETGEKLFARSYKNIRNIISSFEILQKEVAKLKDMRFGQQHGMLLAGYWSLLSEEVITIKKAEELIIEADILRHMQDTEEDEIPDEIDLLLTILSSKVTVQIGEVSSGFRDVTGLISELLQYDNDNVVDQVKMYGIRYDKIKNEFYIAKNHTELKKLLKDSKWSENWSKTLNRLSSKKNVKQRFGIGKENNFNVTVISNAKSYFLKHKIVESKTKNTISDDEIELSV